MYQNLAAARLGSDSPVRHPPPAMNILFFYDIFTEDASHLLLYHGTKKSKMTKSPNQGGPALTTSRTGRLQPWTVSSTSFKVM